MNRKRPRDYEEILELVLMTTLATAFVVAVAVGLTVLIVAGVRAL